MRNFLIYFFASIFIFLLFGCKNNQEKEIKNQITEFYSHYNGNFRQANSKFLTEDLHKKIQKVIDFENKSALLIKKSDHPTDKPHLMEGELFASLYEGYTSFNIKQIKQKNKEASVIIEFTNTNYKINWTDEIIVIDEGGWKIDDVNYLSPTKKNLSLKLVMDEFIQLPLN